MVARKKKEHIFKEVGIPVQNTDLAILNINSVDKVVCVCEDFTDKNHTLIEYVNSKKDKEKEDAGNNSKSRELDIKNIIDSIYNNEHIKNKQKIIDDFGKMFIIDALICNKDRHN